MNYEPVWRPKVNLEEISLPSQDWLRAYRWFDIYPLLFADRGSYTIITSPSPLFVLHFVMGVN